MPSKSSNSVAAERRMDLASLFCLISRHGPAVALAVIAMASVLAGFILYRTVRGKRRKATGAAADGDVKSATAQRDASVIQAIPEEPHSSAESTDMSDEGSAEVKEDLIRSDLRHRRAAAAKTPPPFSPPQKDIQVRDSEHGASDVREDVSETYSGSDTEGAGQSLQSCSPTVEDAADGPPGATDDTTEDVMEEFHDNKSCLKEFVLNEDENHEEEEEKVLQEEECQEVEEVIADNRQEEENFQSALNNPACSEQASLMGDNGDDDRRLKANNKTTLELNSEEPVIQTEDAPVLCTYYGKDEELEEENPDSVDCSSYSESCLFPEEEKRNDWEEVEEERVDYCPTAQQAEICSPTYEQETNLASTQQDQCDQTDEVMLPIRDEDGAPAGEVTEDVIDQDHSNLTDVRSDAHSPQFAEQEVKVKQKEENGEEDGVLCDGADQATEKTLTSDNIVASSEERHSSDVANSSALSCVSTDVTDESHDADGPSDIIHDGKAQISSFADFPDLSLDSQQPQKDEIPFLDQDTDSTIVSPETPSHETESQPENKTGTVTAMAEECSDPHVQSSNKDQESAQMVNNEAFDESSVAAPPDDDTITTTVVAEVLKASVAADTVGTTPPSVDEETSSPQLISINQDQESNHPENNEAFDESSVAAPPDDDTITTTVVAEVLDKAGVADDTDTVDMTPPSVDDDIITTIVVAEVLDKAGVTADTPPSVDEEISPQLISINQDQESNHTENNEGLHESSVVAPPDDDTITTTVAAEVFKTSVAADTDTVDTTLPSVDEETITTTMVAEDFDKSTVAADTDTVDMTLPSVDEETSSPQLISIYQDQESTQMVNTEAFDESTVAAPPDDDTITTTVLAEVLDKAGVAADSDTVDVTPPSVDEEISSPQLISVYQDQESTHTENTETFDESSVNPATDAPACDNAIPLMSEETTCPDTVSSSQDQQSDQTKIHEDFSEVTTGVAPVMTEDISPPVGPFHFPSFEQIELRINDISFPSVGEESGISSMAVSPDLQDAGNEFDMTAGNTVLPEGQSETENRLFAEDVALSVSNEDKADMVFGSQLPQAEHTDWANSFAANEDMFGHEVEESYHREMDQFMPQIVASAPTYSEELKQQTDTKAAVEVGQIKKKEAGVSVEKKEGAKAEEKEEDYEKTEISIMEATMDNNEWITESNYQVLPWMNLSATAFVQDHTKTNQPPAEECKDSSAVTDAGCTDATDIPSSTEVKQISSLSLADDTMESNKKIVAVQPMHQNVNVTFRVQYFTQSPHQMVAVTGDHQELGNWKGYVPLERAKDGQWATVVSLPAESHVEWKFVVVDKGEVCRWEECGNRLLDTGYGDDLMVHKWWGFL